MSANNEWDPGYGNGETVVDLDASRLNTASSTGNEPVGSTTVERNSPPATAESVDQAVAKGGQSKPQVIVRIRPSTNGEGSVFEVHPETKVIQIRVDKEETKRIGGMGKQPPGFIYFPADNVVETSNQDDAFTQVALDVVEKAMEGTPGMIVAVGPEQSGKSFSMFGLNGAYGNRGIVAHALEKMFELKAGKGSEQVFRFGMGIVEVRREKIRDLVTLDPREINDVGDRGPRDMYIEEVDCLEHGIGVLMRGLIGQKLIHQEPYERFHTIVYLEILAFSTEFPELAYFESRLTFAEISAVPGDANVQIPSNPQCTTPISSTPLTASSMSTTRCKSKRSATAFPPQRCRNPGYTTGPLAESIAVRRDIFTLEQIFNRANEIQRLRNNFAKLESLGVSMIASEKRRLSSGHNFRQSRLAHCLKDILDNGTTIKILLHVRPDKAHLKASLEAMRFAERARLLPSSSESAPGKGKSARTEEQILQEVISEIAPELIHRSNVESLTVEKMKSIQEQAVAYFEDNIDSMKVCSKDKVKHMFENFRALWNFLWELELNVSLRKAEEEMKQTYGPRGRSSRSGGAGEGEDFQQDESHHSSNALGGKKGAKKTKKEKSKNKKKQKNQPQESSSTITDQPPDTAPDATQKRGSAGPKDGVDNEGQGIHDDNSSDKKRASQTPPPPAGEGEAEPKPPTEARTSLNEAGGNPPKSPRNSAGNAAPAPELGMANVDLQAQSSEAEGLPSDANIPDVVTDLETEKSSHAIFAHPHFIGRSTIHVPHAALRGGFNDFKLRPTSQGDESEGQDQAVDNFEEIKKIARKQAIHLLKMGVKKPQWMSF